MSRILVRLAPARDSELGVPDAILKKEGELTDEERALMNKHPKYSSSILRPFPGLDKPSLYALHHNESYDAREYPEYPSVHALPPSSIPMTQ